MLFLISEMVILGDIIFIYFWFFRVAILCTAWENCLKHGLKPINRARVALKYVGYINISIFVYLLQYNQYNQTNL